MNNDNSSGITPEDNSENSNKHDDGFEQTGGTDRNSVNPYQPTHHPEDAPGGFNPTYGAQTYPHSAYSSSYQPYQEYGAGNEATTLESTDGRVNVMRAVRFGFRTVFANPAVWILSTLVLGICFVILSVLLSIVGLLIDPDGMAAGNLLSPANLLINVVFFAIGLAVMIFAMRGALIETDGTKATIGQFFRPINLGSTLAVLAFYAVISFAVSALSGAYTADLFIFDEVQGTIETNSSMLTTLLLIILGGILINPLYQYWVYYAADGRENAVGAAQHGFKDALRNYFPLIAYNIIGGIVIIVVSLFTLFLGLLVFLPASILINAHLYRQMSGGKVPVQAP